MRKASCLCLTSLSPPPPSLSPIIRLQLAIMVAEDEAQEGQMEDLRAQVPPGHQTRYTPDLNGETHHPHSPGAAPSLSYSRVLPTPPNTDSSRTWRRTTRRMRRRRPPWLSASPPSRPRWPPPRCVALAHACWLVFVMVGPLGTSVAAFVREGPAASAILLAAGHAPFAPL